MSQPDEAKFLTYMDLYKRIRDLEIELFGEPATDDDESRSPEDSEHDSDREFINDDVDNE